MSMITGQYTGHLQNRFGIIRLTLILEANNPVAFKE
jgi:hypothetical protein